MGFSKYKLHVSVVALVEVFPRATSSLVNNHEGKCSFMCLSALLTAQAMSVLSGTRIQLTIFYCKGIASIEIVLLKVA